MDWLAGAQEPDIPRRLQVTETPQIDITNVVRGLREEALDRIYEAEHELAYQKGILEGINKLVESISVGDGRG